MDERHIVVGATGRFNTVGTAFLFDLENGEQLAELAVSGPAVGSAYGGSVAINGDLALVAATHDDSDELTTGSVHAFQVPSGEPLFSLLPPDLSKSDQFGSSLAVTDDRIFASSKRRFTSLTEAEVSFTEYRRELGPKEQSGSHRGPTRGRWRWHRPPVRYRVVRRGGSDSHHRRTKNVREPGGCIERQVIRRRSRHRLRIRGSRTDHGVLGRHCRAARFSSPRNTPALRSRTV